MPVCGLCVPACSKTAANLAAERGMIMDQNLNGAQQEEMQDAVSAQEQAASAAAQPDTEAACAPEEESNASASANAEETAQAQNIGEAETQSADAAQPTQAEPEKQPKKSAKLGVALAAVVALLAVAAIFLAQALKSNRAPENTVPEAPDASVSEPEQTPEEQPAEQPEAVDGVIAHTNDKGYISYTMTAEQATDEVLQQQVADCGDWTLTNRELSYYYWEQYYTFVSQYGQYVSYILDTTLGLDEQLCDETNTWQQQFLTAAFKRFGMVAAVCQEAETNGYTLDEDAEQQLSEIRANLETSAALYGYDSADAIVQDAFGPHTNAEEYMKFVRNSLLASGYLNSLVEQIEYTDEDLSAYYDAHAEDFTAQGIEKVDKPMISVRHILIQPTETDENGEYTEEAWAQAQTEAERIYAEWEAGERTEDSFAQLAMQYSVDGSASNGGLYEDVYPGMMVTEFNDWCFADGRAVGDSGIVKTKFGYHVMFYSGTTDEIYWITAAKQSYLNEQASALLDEICSRYPVTSNMDNAAVSTLPGQETASEETPADEGTTEEAPADEVTTEENAAAQDSSTEEEAAEK